MNHIISLIIILFIAFLFAVVFVGMALFADIHDDDEARDKARFDTTPDDEDNVILRS